MHQALLLFLFTVGGNVAAFVPSIVPRHTSARRTTLHPVATLDEPTVSAERDFLASEQHWEQASRNLYTPPSCTQKGITLSYYMREMATNNPQLSDMDPIFHNLEKAFSIISALIRRSSLDGFTGLEGNVNVQGEEQKKLDVITNNVLKKVLEQSGKLGVVASEEEHNPVLLCDHLDPEIEDQYVAVFDPLDGSSNVDANVPTGTIFGIFDMEGCDFDTLSDHRLACLEATLQPGKNLKAAGYCLYSGATTLVFTLGDGVHGFTLDDDGEFRLTHPNMRIPDRGNIYSFNEANRWEWNEPTRQYITDIQQGQGQTGQKYTARYIGSMVGDIHRTLLYGGIFGYPADYRNPNGKLRLLYEAAPMSFLLEQAGGLAVTGKERIMALKPDLVHQRVPCLLGSRDDVMEACSYYEDSGEHISFSRTLKAFRMKNKLQM